MGRDCESQPRFHLRQVRRAVMGYGGAKNVSELRQKRCLQRYDFFAARESDQDWPRAHNPVQVHERRGKNVMDATLSMTAFAKSFVWSAVQTLLSCWRDSVGNPTSAFGQFHRESGDVVCSKPTRVGFRVARQSMSPRNRARAASEICSKSSKVRKSMVLNSRSSAGGPQIFAPIER